MFEEVFQLLQSTANGQHSLRQANTGSPMIFADSFQFDAYYDSATNEIVIETTQPDKTWMGLLVGSSNMWGADVI